jgi:4-methoxybenzoate monooxygenase (O-demethylating)
VQVLVGAAKPDPLRFEQPDTFNPRRKGAPHVGFGMGAHHCLGQLVSKMEAECLLAAILDRFERMEVTAAPQYRPLNVLRTLDHLPLRLVPKEALL